MQGEISVSLEREPDVFMAGSIEGERHHTIVARDRAIGAARWNGQPIGLQRIPQWTAGPLGYLSQLRVDRLYRGRVGLLSQGYALMRSLRTGRAICRSISRRSSPTTTPRGGFSAPGSRASRRYQELEPFTTLMLPLWRHQKTGRPASSRSSAVLVERIEDIAACLERNRVRYQFAPRWTAASCSRPSAAAGSHPRDFLIAVRARNGDWLPRALGPEQLQADRRSQLRPDDAALATDSRDLGPAARDPTTAELRSADPARLPFARRRRR